MTDPLTLLNAFADAEHDARAATWSEEDEDAYYDRLGEFLRFVHKPLKAGLNPRGRFFAEDEDFAGPKVEKELAAIRRRTLFAVSSWRDPEHGLMCTGWFGPNTPKLNDGIYQRFHLALDLEPAQVVACDVVCSTCQGSGLRGSEPCEDCSGTGFQPRRGSASLGGDLHAGRVQVVQQPDDERSRSILAAYGA